MIRQPKKSDKKLFLSDIRNIASNADTLQHSIIQMGDGYTIKRQVGGVQTFIPNNQHKKSTEFPYGNKWVFGFEVDTASPLPKVIIHNPALHRGGLTIAEWMVPGMPSRDSIELTPALTDWAITGDSAKTIITYRYDTHLSVGTLIASDIASDAMTVPTDDGAGTVDPLRYYLIPLYILVAKHDTNEISRVRIYIDLIHGIFSPGLAG